jgi:maltose O-acetyltransferase
MMGAGVTLLKDNHEVDSGGRALPGRTEPNPPTIADGAWIGDRAIVLPGRSIGEYAIVGAGAVVTRDVPAYAVVGGNPAQVIRIQGKGER